MTKETIKKMIWDSKFFNIRCGKAFITTKEDMESLIEESLNYDFVSIQNIGNKISINKLIAENTDAFLADINIQFIKRVEVNNNSGNDCIIISTKDANRKYNIKISKDDFIHSKFIEDDNFRLRNGYKVYEEWIKNSIDEDDKFFSIQLSECDDIKGFILFKMDDTSVILELVKVNERYRGEGVCSQLISTIENYAMNNGVRDIHVGTQVNNIAAINLYHKLGYKEVSRTSVYHWWLNK